jgi:hypothetical protein
MAVCPLCFLKLLTLNLMFVKDDLLSTFMPEVDRFLAEFIRLEGRAECQSCMCSCCTLRDAEIHCRDCIGGDLWCVECCVQFHAYNPLHRVQVSQCPLKLGSRSEVLGLIALEWSIFCQDLPQSPWTPYPAGAPHWHSMFVPTSCLW